MFFDNNHKYIVGLYPFSLPVGSNNNLSLEDPFTIDYFNNLSYAQWMNDTVYYVRNDSLEVQALLDFGENGVPHHLKSLPAEEQMSQLILAENKYVLTISNFYQGKDFISFTFIHKNQLAFYFKNKEQEIITESFYSEKLNSILPTPRMDRNNWFIILDESNLSNYPSVQLSEKLEDEIIHKGKSFILYGKI